MSFEETLNVALSKSLDELAFHIDKNESKAEDKIYTTPDILTQTPGELFLQNLANDPIGHALRLAVREVGRIAYKHGGTKLMQQISTKIADPDTIKGQFRIGIVDKAWDGIGDWIA